MSIFVMVEATPVKDILTTDITGPLSNPNYIFGVCITPKSKCTLNSVTLLGNSTSGTLYIAKGDNFYGSYTGMVSQAIVYGQTEQTLTTPYVMEKDTNYVIGCSGSYMVYYDGAISYPKSGTNVVFNYSFYSYVNTQYTNLVYNIGAVTTIKTA